MGLFINIGNAGFQAARNGEYIDKSELIAVVNSTLCSERQFSCVSRARRFGKSMAAKMLNAYYDKSCDSSALFQDLKIAADSSYLKHLNRYPVLYVDMTNFVTRYRNDVNIVRHLENDIIAELREVYKNINYTTNGTLLSVLYSIVQQAEPQKFIMIVDEWDAVLREFNFENDVASKYVDFLRLLFKSVNSMSVFAGVYMTGILPIKKYNTQSALNNFEEYTMLAPGAMSSYFGFTEKEVDELCLRYPMDKEQLKIWYDGYRIGEQKSIYNPLSVIRAILRNYCESYWANTGTFETIVHYIKMNFDGLKDDIINLLSGGECDVNTKYFQNDLNVINSKNDVLTVLIHLGYLSYDRDTGKCHVPNKEISLEFAGAVEDVGWNIVADALKQSENLLKWTIEGVEKQVANAIGRVHSDSTSILQYNDENSLACVLSIAYYSAKNYYHIIREMPTGLGFADLVFIPNLNVDMPVIIVELKYDHSVKTAMSQIKNKHYPDSLLSYYGEIILVGITYNRKTKEHSCLIERIKKNKNSQSKLTFSQSNHKVGLVYSQSIHKVILLLESLRNPLSAREMREICEKKDVSYFNRSTIQPMLVDGIIAQVDANSVRSPKQKYFITEKGLHFLSELKTM